MVTQPAPWAACSVLNNPFGEEIVPDSQFQQNLAACMGSHRYRRAGITGEKSLVITLLQMESIFTVYLHFFMFWVAIPINQHQQHLAVSLVLPSAGWCRT